MEDLAAFLVALAFAPPVTLLQSVSLSGSEISCRGKSTTRVVAWDWAPGGCRHRFWAFLLEIAKLVEFPTRGF